MPFLRQRRLDELRHLCVASPYRLTSAMVAAMSWGAMPTGNSSTCPPLRWNRIGSGTDH
jgi:hypothetical protein